MLDILRVYLFVKRLNKQREELQIDLFVDFCDSYLLVERDLN